MQRIYFSTSTRTRTYYFPHSINTYPRLVMRYYGMFVFCVFLIFACWDLSRAKPDEELGCRGNIWHHYDFQIRTEKNLRLELNYTGQKYAGRGEFPWLVEIRQEPQDDFSHQANWSNGNLVTSTHVLTTCNAVANLVRFRAENLRQAVFLHRLTKRDPNEWKVMFSEDYTYKTAGSNTGTRKIRQFHVHPKCSNIDFQYHWGVAEVKKPIFPNPPWIGYIHLDYDVNGYKNAVSEYCSYDVITHCHVGLWGRNTHGSYGLDTMWNYKKKYIVHPIDPDYCYQSINVYPWEYRGGPPVKSWNCMGIHKNDTTGVVCDRDRGAPIVCGGVVRAVVLAGAIDTMCNRTNPLPFIVMNIRHTFNMFVELDVRPYKLSGLKEFGRIVTDKRGQRYT